MIVVSCHYRRCTHCGEFKTRRSENFQRRKNGHWYSWCRKCRRLDATERYRQHRQDPAYVIRYRAQANAARRRRRREDPERERERTRREYAQQMARPGVLERKAERQRRNYQIRNGHLPVEPPWQPLNKQSWAAPVVTAKPLTEWLRWAFPNRAAKELADWLGEDDQQIRRLLRGEAQRISLHIADRILVHAGRPDLLDAFYPMEDA